MFRRKHDIFDVIIDEVLDDILEDNVLDALHREKNDLLTKQWKKGYISAVVTIAGAAALAEFIRR